MLIKRPCVASAILLSSLAAVAIASAAPARSAPPAAARESGGSLIALLASPALAESFLADADNLDRLMRAAEPTAERGAGERGRLDEALAALERLLPVEEMRSRARLALGVLNYRLGSIEAAQGHLQAALADKNMPMEFRDRAEALLRRTQAPRPSSRLFGTITAGVNYQATNETGLDGFPADYFGGGEENWSARNVFAQLDLRHRFNLAAGANVWESTVRANVTRPFDEAEADYSLLSLASGPQFALQSLGLPGLTLRTVAAIDYGVVNAETDFTAFGASLALDQRIGGGKLAFGVDWRQRRYVDNTVSPSNSARSGRELAGRLAYDFKVADWLAASASARYADYTARRAYESYGEWQLNVSLNSTLQTFIKRQTSLLASSDWRLGLFDIGAAAGEEQGWGGSGRQSSHRGGFELSQSVSLIVQGGWTRRDALFPHLEYETWFGKTGVAWQF